MRILIVEDDLELQEMITALLHRIDPQIEVDTAVNGEETIGLMSSQILNPKFNYDLIISDVTLEGSATGFDLWKFCSKKFPSTYFVFMSGISQVEFFDKLKDDPQCPPFLSKPFVMEKFRELINEVMSR